MVLSFGLLSFILLKLVSSQNNLNLVRNGVKYCNKAVCNFRCPDALGNLCSGVYVCGPNTLQCNFYCEPDNCENIHLVSFAQGDTNVDCKDESGCKHGFHLYCGSRAIPGRLKSQFRRRVVVPANHSQNSCNVLCGEKSCEQVNVRCQGNVRNCYIQGLQNHGSGMAIKDSNVICNFPRTNPNGTCTLKCGSIGRWEHFSCDAVRYGCVGKYGNCYCTGESCHGIVHGTGLRVDPPL